MSAEPRTIRTNAEVELGNAFRSALPRLPGNDSARTRRTAAFALFERSGLPHRRIEEWKYTDLRALVRTAAPMAPTPRPEALALVAEQDPVGQLDRAQVVIANGIYRAELSDLAGVDGVTIESLADVLSAAPERVGTLFADSDDTVMALNTALMTGGAVITVARGAKPARPIEIVHLSSGETPFTVVARDVVSVGDNASVRFVESHRGPGGVAYQVNTLTELRIGNGASVTWARLQAEGGDAQHLSSFIAEIGRDAQFDHLAVNAGAALCRWSGIITITGPGARVGFSGTTMLSAEERGDTLLIVNHTEPHCVSRELFKAAIDGRSQGAFQGRIVVKQKAQKTDAKMMTQALLLSDDGEFAAKPELEIFADDVQCGHGATSGRIDETMLFYLMARGVPRAEAERLLIEAFLDDAIDAIRDEPIAEALKGSVTDWLKRR